MPEGDSVENRKGNHCNIDKLGDICQTKTTSSECFFIMHPPEHLNQKQL